jgi:DNA mismatch repair protein MutL
MDVAESKISTILDEIIHNLELGKSPRQEQKTTFAMGMARQLAIRAGQKLDTKEMALLIDALFSCQVPEVSIDGEPILKTLTLAEIHKKFQE